MTTNKFLVLLIFVYVFTKADVANSQTYSQGDSLAIFYPDNFDSTGTLPSLAIINEPIVAPGLPANWSLVPEFYVDDTLLASCAKFDIGKNVDLYGTGEVTGQLRRNNTEINLWNTDNFRYRIDDGKELYQSHPWVMGVRADGSSFGIIADNTWKMTINLTDSEINFISYGPPFRIIIFEAKTPQALMESLATLTGKMELPPLWALGYHQSRCSYAPSSYVKDIANTLRSKNLPCDVIWLDFLYQNNFKTFTFSPSYFPDPNGLNNYLHAENFKSVWIVDPGIAKLTGYGPYDQGTSGNLWVLNKNRSPFIGDVWPGSCVFPDFTMPATRLWWSGLCSAFIANGIDGIWNDMNEPSVFNTNSGTMPEDNVHLGGGGLPEDSHLRYHNVYGMLMIKATREGLLQANPDKRPFVLTRSNFLGGQRYAATWTGDNGSSWDYLKMSIPMSLNLSLSGEPFNGPDVGGYDGTSTENLVGHWMAVGAFYPFFRNHHNSNNQEPWAFGATIEQVSRIALSRRYKLLPYIYMLFYEASKTGMPVMRPVFFADPTDKDLRTEQEAFLLGDKLLIVPKWARDPSLPKDLWRSISIAGEDSKLDPYQPDVRLRNGSILPIGKLIQSTEDYSTDSLTLLVSIDDNHNAKGYLYDDAGNGFDYLHGEYLIRNFEAEGLGNDSLKITCTKKEGNLPINDKKYRVGMVTNYDIVYSSWTSDTIIKIGLPVEIYSEITSPISGSGYQAGENIHITAEAGSDIGIEKVEFLYDDSITIGEDKTSPYEIETDSIPSGSHVIYAIAWASSELKMETYPIKINIGVSAINKLTQNQNIIVYPNPANDIVTLQLKGILSEQCLTLYDMLGRNEYQAVLIPGRDNIQIDVKNLKDGVYFIELKTQNSIITQKLIIQR